MSLRRPHSPSSDSPAEAFRPENFKRRATLGDWLIYLIVGTLLLGLIGGAVYYFTRPEQEKAKLRVKAERVWNETILRNPKEAEEPRRIRERANPQLNEVFGEDPAPQAEVPLPPVIVRSEPKVAVTTYSGSGQRGLIILTDPALPRASAEFIRFAEALKVSGVVEGNPSKVMLNGRLLRAGDMIGHDSGVTFVEVDGERKALILRDQTGAELRLPY